MEGVKLAYIKDQDLEFLSQLDSSDLDDLVICLTQDKDGKSRISEELTMTENYKKYYPNHQHYWQEIAAELQCFGANTIATMFRGGKGVPYKEILCDVCDKLKVNYNKDSSTLVIENNLLMKILTDAVEKMSPQELKELAEASGVKNVSNLNAQSMVAIFQTAFKAGGFKSYQLTLIVVNAVAKALTGRGLSLIANNMLTKVLKVVTGPIGWVVTGLWTVYDIAGSAYRVTIPAVLYIALLRQKHIYEKSEEVTFS